MKILITGGSGFIGSALCKSLALYYDITGTYHENAPPSVKIPWVQVDLLEPEDVAALIETARPDVIVHAAGLKQGGLLKRNERECLRVNGLATERLCTWAAQANPRVLFIYLSSVSVYGIRRDVKPFREEDPCYPTETNGISKLFGEERLRYLIEKQILKDVLIFRLAPCYDKTWTRNLERRIMIPGQMSYIRYGSGEQKMSALARGNVINAIGHVLKNRGDFEGFQIFNLCDRRPYSFNELMKVIQLSGILPHRPVFTLPTPLVNFFSLGMPGGAVGKLSMLNTYQAKVFRDMTYDSGKLIEKGVNPVHTLETVFLKS